MRLDVEESTVDSIYVTIWASLLLPLHMGKTENASTMMENHFGRTLQVYMVDSVCFCRQIDLHGSKG